MADEQTPQLRDEFKITRSGKQFVLFAGLLDLAHQIGMEYIHTQPLVIPTGTDGVLDPKATCVVHAEVKMADGRTFHGIGDANAENVGRNIQPHIIRMAETRAKARALRDAVNVGATALEELGEDDDASTTQQRQRAEKAGRSAPTPLLASEDQRAEVVTLCTKLGGTIQQLEETRGKPFEKWTRSEANKQITALEDKVESRKQEGTS